MYSAIMSRLLLSEPAAPAADVSRVDCFLARVDRELPAMVPGEQRKFLDRLIAIWEQRYSAFIKSGGRSEHYGGVREPINVSDFTLTIAGLAARRDAIRGRG